MMSSHNNGDFYSAENLASREAEVSKRSLIKARRVVSSSLTVTVTSKSISLCGFRPPSTAGAVQMYGQQRRFEMALDDANYL